jgi:hypothetical protein
MGALRARRWRGRESPAAAPGSEEEKDREKSEEEARQMNRTPIRKNQLLLIAGRVEGVPQIRFDEQPVGTVAANMACTDVCNAVQSHVLKRMMRLKLQSETPLEVVSFSNVQGAESPAAELFAENVDTFNWSVDCANRV